MKRSGPQKGVNREAHPWGEPPWRVEFRAQVGELPERADVVVVGGGFSGLSAAAWLRRLAPQKSMLVLESALIGEGASGRTGGMALAETAAGDLPGLGDVLDGYKQIMRELNVDSRLALPGAWELGHSHGMKDSPIQWSDSGLLRAVRQVPGGTVDPGKVVAGLAHAAETSGAQIAEHCELKKLEFAGRPLRLDVQQKFKGRIEQKQIVAEKVLLATNARSLENAGLQIGTAAKLTMAVATEPLSEEQIEAIGLASRKPFYTIDLPYLWGRLMESNAAIFGAGLVPAYSGPPELFPLGDQSKSARSRDLYRYDVRRGEAAERIETLETRVRNLHPALKRVRITHRWGGPILLTEEMRPIFRRHPRNERVTVLAGYNGHGVALSVYLGKWAAEAMLERRELPRWN
jgi:glycine/D-amino acid oxidase-like deaminating enzyme